MSNAPPEVPKTKFQTSSKFQITSLKMDASSHHPLLLAIVSLLFFTASLHADDEPKGAAPEDSQAVEMKKRELTERILKNTADARNGLVEKNAGAGTQKLQQDVVADLEALIDLLKKSPPPSGGSSSSSSSSSNSQNQDQEQQSNSESKSSKKQKPQGTGSGKERDTPQDSEERDGESRESQAMADRKLRLENDIWGHLPPALREQLLNTYGERMLPQYEEFVRKFYEALSEPARTKKRPR